MMHKLNEKFPHLEIHPEIGLKNLPRSSSSSHLFLKAVDILEKSGEISSEVKNYSLLGLSDREIRPGYFRDVKDVAILSEQLAIAEQLEIPCAKIEKLLSNGHARAADTEANNKNLIAGSPTFVFNEGRLKLYGNINYKIVATNIRALSETSTTPAT